MHTFTFFHTEPCGQIRMNLASWEILHLEPSVEELRVRLEQASIDIILGDCIRGRFAYMPDLGIGFPADDLDNTERSSHRLSDALDCESAAAVAYALKNYASC